MPQVVLNVRKTVVSLTTPVSPITVTGTDTITVGAGSNRAIAVWLISASKTIGYTAVTFGAQALTLIKAQNASANGRIELWGGLQAACPTGQQDLVITFSGTAGDTIYIYMEALNEVDQTAFASTFKNADGRAATGSGAISDNVSGQAGDWTLDALACDSALFSANTQTLGFNNSDGNSACGAGSDNNGSGGTSWSFGWTLDRSANYAHAWVTIAAVGNIGGGGSDLSVSTIGEPVVGGSTF